MTIAESILPEFDREMALTRTLLERVPGEHAAWKPHPKSMSLGTISVHLANIAYWAVIVLNQSEFDVSPPGGTAVAAPFETTEALLATFDKNVMAARAMLESISDADMMAPWTLKKGGEVITVLPRVAVLRVFVMNHSIHHRGQLTVYLRLQDVPLPPIYGPTADTPDASMV